MKRIIIIGAGGNSKVIIDIILSRVAAGEEIQIFGVLDDDGNKTSLRGYPVLGTVDKMQTFLRDEEIYFVNGVGDNLTRKKIYETCQTDRYFTAIHPSVIVGNGVTIDSGCVIMPGVIINADSRIGKQTLINTGAIVEHDNKIGTFSHLASGVVTAGNVTIGECTMLGTGTKVIQGITIGSNVIIGAGAVVINDVEDNVTAVGIPAKIIKSFNNIGVEK